MFMKERRRAMTAEPQQWVRTRNTGDASRDGGSTVVRVISA